MSVIEAEGRPFAHTADQATPGRSVAGRRHLGRALGGVAAQGSQAVASLILQLVALRALGLEGLAVFGTLYAVLIVATAVSSGFVGDSLTVLDRGTRRIRAGLQIWALVIFAGAGSIVALALSLSGFVSGWVAVIFGVTTAIFLAEDILRRLLMANLLFWRIVIIDLVGVLAALVVLGATAWAGRPIGLETLFVALLIGQLVAGAVAVGCLPRAERFVVPMRSAALREVAAYGLWRAAQQASRPAAQAAIRFLCVALVSLAVVGELEAARIYLAPATVAIAGLTSVLFATYAAERSVPLAAQLRRADRSIAVLVVAVGLLVLGAVLAVPVLGGLLTGGAFEVSQALVAGWGLYAMAVAVATPYGALAAARGRQRAVLAVRGVEVALSLIGVGVLLTFSDAVWLVPLLLGVVTMIIAVVTRNAILGRMVADDRPNSVDFRRNIDT